MRWLVVVVLASCGRIDFTPIALSGTGDGGGAIGDGTHATAPSDAGGTNPVSCADRTVTQESVAGTITLTGTLGGSGVNASGSCGGSVAEDLYELDVGTNDGVLLDTGTSSTADVVLYLRTTCDDPSTEIGCTVSKTDGPATLYYGPLAAGTYYLFVDGNAPGTYSVSAESLLGNGASCDFLSDCGLGLDCIDGTVGMRCLGSGPGSCSVAQPFDGAGSFSATASNINPGSFHAAQCGNSDGGWYSPETIYTVALANGISDLHVSTIGAATNYDTVVYVESACDGPLIACNDDASGDLDGASDLHTGPLVAGMYYVFVDGYDGAMGTAAVTIDATP